VIPSDSTTKTKNITCGVQHELQPNHFVDAVDKLEFFKSKPKNLELGTDRGDLRLNR
jgi:hypothetical protein